MSAIEISDAAIKAAAAVVIGYIDDDPPPNSVERVVRPELEAAAPLIVAPHLRRIADRLAVILPNSRAAQAVLRAEADRLDPTGSAA